MDAGCATGILSDIVSVIGNIYIYCIYNMYICKYVYIYLLIYIITIVRLVRLEDDNGSVHVCCNCLVPDVTSNFSSQKCR